MSTLSNYNWWRDFLRAASGSAYALCHNLVVTKRSSLETLPVWVAVWIAEPTSFSFIVMEAVSMCL